MNKVDVSGDFIEEAIREKLARQYLQPQVRPATVEIFNKDNGELIDDLYAEVYIDWENAAYASMARSSSGSSEDRK